eukprot:358445-Chlamydomonas_euryale.AAC.25
MVQPRLRQLRVAFEACLAQLPACVLPAQRRRGRNAPHQLPHAHAGRPRPRVVGCRQRGAVRAAASAAGARRRRDAATDARAAPHALAAADRHRLAVASTLNG